MIIMKKNIKWLLLASLSFVACNKNDDTITEVPVTAGSANFSKYVALGDSFAAGYSDGALFKKGQENAYPNILAGQFAQAGGGTFNTPFMADNIGGFAGSMVYTPRLIFDGSGPASLGLPPYSQAATTNQLAHLSGSFNNMGIPGAKSFHLLTAGYGSPAGNPYFARFASNPMAKVIDDALAQAPTFFSLWIGGNDELGYATAGGDPAVNPLTSNANFDAAYNALASQLAAGGKKGVVANLPYVTTLPYFYVIKYNQLKQSDLTVSGVNQVSALNTQLYAPLHNALAFLGQGSRINLLSTTGNNPMLMIDENLTDLSASLTAVLVGGGLDVPTATALGQVFGKARQTISTDLICLGAAQRIGKEPSMSLDGVASPSPLLSQLGVTFPLPDRYVLLPTEVAEIKVATDHYNATIENAANANGLAFVDAKAIMDQLVNGGVRFGNYHMTAQYVTGGAFSLDGVHPSARGYALIANKFAEAINAKYGSTLKPVDIGNYQIQYPASL
ncbi:SGNH/GDSL hydrolase family protein [Flavobacterium psychrophilum]|nr:Putative membrane spanning protein [Flavobacterium psychrophilum]SNA73973.1 putative lipoprotein [Flavobacterium psychrophilum]SNA77582.1 putative lipoprotein [Flavobacterium psychrophilum]SNA80053.1 putative lipoprotein [Flavobacterium psychrophilum]SNB03492.1 putative lipoprotein [Flavobacterium psychrophilum]